MTKKRIEAVQGIIIKNLFDAFLVTNQKNVFYLTGIPIEPDIREITAFVTKDSIDILVNSTYMEAARGHGRELTLHEVTRTTKLTDHLNRLTDQHKTKQVAFEAHDLTVDQLQKLRGSIKSVVWKETLNLVEELRRVKDADELSSIKQAVQITDQAYEFIREKIEPGVREKDIAIELEMFMKRNADGIAFSPIVASGVGSASPHYISSDKKISQGEMLLLDFGAKIKGYCADLTRVVFVGQATEKFKKAYLTVLDAQNQTLEFLQKKASSKGIVTKDVDKVARDYIVKKGYPDIPHGVGHSLGLDIHELPRLSPISEEKLKPNMVFTIEPGIYLPDWGGVRIEDTIAWTDQGLAILTKSPKKLQEIID